MSRFSIILCIGASLVLAACGNSASAGNTASPSPGIARAPRGGASGQLVQINGNTLILTGANGDVTVTYTTTTTITKMSTATLADITAGKDILAHRGNESFWLAPTPSHRRATPELPGRDPRGAAVCSPPRAPPPPRPT